MLSNVNDGYELVDINSLAMHPENPRIGDVAAIGASIEENGFYGAVVVQRSTRWIIAGAHRWGVLRAKDEKLVPVIWVDVDDDAAVKIMLADNRTNDLAGYNRETLVSLLDSVVEAGTPLRAVAYTQDDLDALMRVVVAPEKAPSGTFDVEVTVWSERAQTELKAELELEGYCVELVATT